MGDEKSYSASFKIKSFFKQKMALIILSLGCLLFALKDGIEWGQNDVDILVMISSMIITYLFTMYVVIIMGKMGIQAGKSTDAYISTLKYYSEAKLACEPFRNHLGEYCKLKTEEEKKLIQSRILEEENLDVKKIDSYKQSELTKEQWKCVQKARKVKVIRLQERDLVSERGWQKKNQFGTYLGKSENEFVKKNNISNAISKLLVPIVLTVISIESINPKNILAGLIKVVIILFGGLINYLTNESFASNELRNRFINKADALIDFKSLYEKGVFDEKPKVDIKEIEHEFIPN